VRFRISAGPRKFPGVDTRPQRPPIGFAFPTLGTDAKFLLWFFCKTIQVGVVCLCFPQPHANVGNFKQLIVGKILDLVANPSIKFTGFQFRCNQTFARLEASVKRIEDRSALKVRRVTNRLL